MLQTERTQNLKISRNKDKWPQLTGRKSTRKTQILVILFMKEFHVAGHKGRPRLLHKNFKDDPSCKQLQIWFLALPLNISMMRSSRKDLRLLSTDAKTRVWERNSSGEAQRKHWGKKPCSAEVNLPAARWERTHEDTALVPFPPPTY